MHAHTKSHCNKIANKAGRLRSQAYSFGLHLNTPRSKSPCLVCDFSHRNVLPIPVGGKNANKAEVAGIVTENLGINWTPSEYASLLSLSALFVISSHTHPHPHTKREREREREREGGGEY